MKVDIKGAFPGRLHLPATGENGSDSLFRHDFDTSKGRIKSAADGEWTYTFRVKGDSDVARIKMKLSGEDTEYGPIVSIDKITYHGDAGEVLAKVTPEVVVAPMDSLPLENFVRQIANSYSSNASANLFSNDIALGGARNDVAYLGNGNDIAKGRSGHDELGGEAGEDKLLGGGGRDTLIGGDGQDTLNGGNGNDSLDGGDGNDLLNGSRGRDILTGGAGQDGFEFHKRGGRDTISDFENDLDTILLDTDLWGGGLTKAQVVEQFASFEDGAIKFDFGREELVVDGVFNAASLADDIQFI